MRLRRWSDVAPAHAGAGCRTGRVATSIFPTCDHPRFSGRRGRALVARASGTVARGTVSRRADEVPGIAPRELAARLDRGDDLDLIDVREPYEHRIASIPGARLIPLRGVEEALPTLDPRRELVLLCHHGVRSLAAAELLRARGFDRVWNLTGGIDRWSDEVDPGVPRY